MGEMERLSLPLDGLLAQMDLQAREREGVFPAWRFDQLNVRLLGQKVFDFIQNVFLVAADRYDQNLPQLAAPLFYGNLYLCVNLRA